MSGKTEELYNRSLKYEVSTKELLKTIFSDNQPKIIEAKMILFTQEIEKIKQTTRHKQSVSVEVKKRFEVEINKLTSSPDIKIRLQGQSLKLAMINELIERSKEIQELLNQEAYEIKAYKLASRSLHKKIIKLTTVYHGIKYLFIVGVTIGIIFYLTSLIDR